MAKSISRYLADVASPTGVLDGTLSTAAQTNVTSVGTLSSLTVSGNLNATLTTAAQGNITSLGTLTALTVDNLGINGNTITANSGALNLTPASGSAIVLDGTINVDAGVVTGATSITSTAFVGGLTGNVTGNASGTAATVTGAAQTNITSLGTLTTLTVDDITINGSTISDAGEFTLDIGGDIVLDSDNGVWRFKDAGTSMWEIARDGSSYLSFYSAVSNMDMQFKGNDGGSPVTAMTIDMSEGGNVGIGTGVPSSYYSKNLVVMADGDGTGGITIAAPATDDNTYLAFADGTSGTAAYAGYVGYRHNTGEYLMFGAGGSTRMYVTEDGNVGIGTNNPSAGLMIQTSTDGTGLSGADKNVAYFNNQEATAGQNYGLRVRGGTNATDYAFRVDTTNATGALEVDGSGNIGIGVGASLARFNLLGDVANWTAIFKNTNSNAYGFQVDLSQSSAAGGQANIYAHAVYTPAGVGAFLTKDGVMTIGHATNKEVRVDQNLAVTKEGARGGMSINSWYNSASGPLFDFNVSRSNTAGSHTVIQNGDALGTIIWRGDDGDEFKDAAAIEVNVDASPGNDDMAGRFVFYTAPDGSTGLQERLRIDNQGYMKHSYGGTAKPARFVTSTAQGITVGSTDADNAGRGVHLAHDNSSTGYLHAYNYGSAAYDPLQFRGSRVDTVGGTGHNVFRACSNGLFSIGSATYTQGRIRQFVYTASVSNGTTVDLFYNAGAYDDLHLIATIEATHSSRTYRYRAGPFGYYQSLPQVNAGVGLDFTSATVNTGRRMLQFSNSSGYTAATYISVLIIGDNGVTVSNGAISDLL